MVRLVWRPVVAVRDRGWREPRDRALLLPGQGEQQKRHLRRESPLPVEPSARGALIPHLDGLAARTLAQRRPARRGRIIFGRFQLGASAKLDYVTEPSAQRPASEGSRLLGEQPRLTRQAEAKRRVVQREW